MKSVVQGTGVFGENWFVQKITCSGKNPVEFIVDDHDFERLSKFRWYASVRGKLIKRTYAIRYFTENKKMQPRAVQREIMGLIKGDARQVDHINGDTLDNRRSNLRICTRSENRKNNRKLPYKKYKGITKSKKKWFAQILHNGETRYLGTHETEIAEARAYDEGAKRLHGEFASLNFPEVKNETP